jgi:SAM-dependent methyltransferase
MRDFARWYDILYAHKAYHAEALLALDFIKEFNGTHEHLLEIGAGTGNHTLQLYPYTKRLTAVEIDSEMGSIGKLKTKDFDQIDWYTGSIENTDSSLNVDAVMALFYVLNYIHAEVDLESFLVNIQQRMKNNALFIFDCWNGDKHFSHDFLCTQREFSVNHYVVNKEIATTMQKAQQFAEIKYDIKIRDDKNSSTYAFTECIKIRRWTMKEIENITKKIGLKILAIRSHDNVKNSSSASDPHLWYILKK